MTRLKLFILASAVTLGASTLFADDLQLGGNFNTFNILENGSAVSTGGGSITTSYLNGAQLAWVYCVGLFTDVNVPDDYADTVTTTNGFVNGAFVHNDGEIAWLVDTYAKAAEGNVNAEEGLQAAIWSVEYDSKSLGEPVVTGESGQGYSSFYTSDLAGLGTKTAAVSSVDWFSPGNGSSTTYQGLVGPGPTGAVPEPTSIVLFGTVALFGVKLMKRKKTGIVL